MTNTPNNTNPGLLDLTVNADASATDAKAARASSCFVEAPVSGETRVGAAVLSDGANGHCKALESFSGSNLDRLLLIAEANAKNLARILDLIGRQNGKRSE